METRDASARIVSSTIISSNSTTHFNLLPAPFFSSPLHSFPFALYVLCPPGGLAFSASSMGSLNHDFPAAYFKGKGSALSLMEDQRWKMGLDGPLFAGSSFFLTCLSGLIFQKYAPQTSITPRFPPFALHCSLIFLFFIKPASRLTPHPSLLPASFSP